MYEYMSSGKNKHDIRASHDKRMECLGKLIN